jgi:hypothetical protein
MPILLNAATTTQTGAALVVYQVNRTFQATVAGTGAVSATVIIEGSNDGANFLTLGTITLSGTTSASDGFVSDAAWGYVRARLTAISGTGAAVTVAMGA